MVTDLSKLSPRIQAELFVLDDGHVETGVQHQQTAPAILIETTETKMFRPIITLQGQPGIQWVPDCNQLEQRQVLSKKAADRWA
jgi:hypothetical protein